MDKILIKSLNLLRENNNLNEIIKILLLEKKKNPKDKEILFQLGGAYRSLGNFEAALANYEDILKYDESYTPAFRMIGTIINHKQNDKYLKKLEILKEKNELLKTQKIDLFFALGKAYEDLNENEKSSDYYIRANNLKKSFTKYNFNSHKEHFEQIYKIFKDINFNIKKTYSANTKKIIFICGLPRSGSTLFENIIASHKDVYSGGELPYLQRAIKKHFVENNNISKEKIFNHLDNKNKDFNNDYFKSLINHNFSEKNVTDKQLDNFRWIGLIKLFFPNSKIILCKRNPRSNATSIYKNNFNTPTYNWTNDPKDILCYFSYYNKIINIWKNKFPNELFEIEYEELVDKKDDIIKKIINNCELDWDPNCLLFYKNKSPIKTASAFQARQPIYNSSVNKDASLFKNIFSDQDFSNI